jgi:hypothetical protein
LVEAAAQRVTANRLPDATADAQRDGLTIRWVVECGKAWPEELAEEVEHVVLPCVDQRAEAGQLDRGAVRHVWGVGHVIHQHFERPIQRVRRVV